MALPVNTLSSDQATPKSRLAIQVSSGRKKAEKIAAEKAAAAKKYSDKLAAVKRNNAILAQRESRRKRSADLKLNNRVCYILGRLVLKAIHTVGHGVFVVNALTLAALSDKERGLLDEVLFNLSQDEAVDASDGDGTQAIAAPMADKVTGETSDGEADDRNDHPREIDINFDV